MTRSVEPSAVGGVIRAPASKSAMQRAIACAALAPGISTITNPTWCADSLAAMGVARALGAKIERQESWVTVHGGIRGKADSNKKIVASCGESGLCMRMFSAIASLSGAEVELRAEGSLAGRPVSMLEGPLTELGVRCSTDRGFPPVRVQGPLLSGTAHVDGSESSQFLTGLLLALPMSGGDSTVYVNRLASRGYIDLSLDVARAFGAQITRDSQFSEFRVRGDSPYVPADYEVEGDWSGAAFLLVAGAIAASKPLFVMGLSADSSQPDRAIIDALRLAGASLATVEGGWRVEAATLSGFTFDATDCPDLFPPLVALASRCTGVTKLTGASRLRAKESDRAAALAEEFGSLGLRVSVDGDELSVEGFGSDHFGSGRIGSGQLGSNRTGSGQNRCETRLSPGLVSSRGDHRIAMAVAVAALAGSGTVAIQGAECVNKSYPDFFEALDSIRL